MKKSEIKQYIDESWGLADARVRQGGVHVWALVNALQESNNDQQELARRYQLPLDAVEAALAYYRLHHALIDARIEMNLG